MTDPFTAVAAYFGITPAEVAAMTDEQIADLRTCVRAQLDQSEAALSELGIRLTDVIGDQP